MSYEQTAEAETALLCLPFFIFMLIYIYIQITKQNPQPLVLASLFNKIKDYNLYSAFLLTPVIFYLFDCQKAVYLWQKVLKCLRSLLVERDGSKDSRPTERGKKSPHLFQIGDLLFFNSEPVFYFHQEEKTSSRYPSCEHPLESPVCHTGFCSASAKWKVFKMRNNFTFLCVILSNVLLCKKWISSLSQSQERLFSDDWEKLVLKEVVTEHMQSKYLSPYFQHIDGKV